jgi:hypothetical protein
MILTTPRPNGAAEDWQARRKIGWLARVLIGLIVACALLECILRFALGLGNPVLIQPDSACSYILKPDQDVLRFFVRTHINHYGMRSDEVSGVHQAGTLRLLFVGDSVTYGTSRVDQKKIFTEVLHRELPAIAHQPIEVLNASAGAWAPSNELSYIQSRGIFQSDIVLLVLNDGDLTQPRATLADVGDNLPQTRPLTAIGELYTRYILPGVIRTTHNVDAGDTAAGDSKDLIRENLENLDRFKELVTTQGARMMVIYIPFSRDIPDESRAAAKSLHTWSDAHHIAMFDLTSAEAPYLPNDISLDGGTHLNVRGHLVVARAVEQSWPELSRSP